MTKYKHLKLNKVAEIKLIGKAAIEEFLSTARPILDGREIVVESGYWLHSDEGEDYCLDCIKKRLSDFDWSKDIGDRFGGGYCTESDGCRICEDCGKLLDYTLTDYGVDNELDHFRENGFDWSSSQQCYEMARIAHGIYTDQQKRRLYNVLKRGKNLPGELK